MPATSDRKLLAFMNSIWWSILGLVIWCLFGLNDYRHHSFSWMDGLLIGIFSFQVLMTGVPTLVYKWRHGKRHKN